MNNKQQSINGLKFYSGLAAGINNLLDYKNKLDEINVYPVPDGDTGTNMCFTLLPVVEECEKRISESISDSLDAIADTALDSARGNSGTIIAQFFHGMRKSVLGLDVISVEQFSSALNEGYKSAKDSLLNPAEGTIITVMREVANFSMELSQKENINFELFLDKCYHHSIQSLEETKTTLKILRKSDVVDAGALGFVLLIQGWLNSVQKNTKIQTHHIDISYDHDKIDSLKKDVDFTIKNKFCTECAIEGNNINKIELKEMIKNLGDSMVVAGTKNRVKIHIHTNSPAKLYKICGAYGKVKDRKVDDMTKQEHTIHHNEAGGIAIVVDSGADIPEEYANEIQVVPVRYSFGNQQHIDKVTQSTSEFYQQMKTDSNHPKTSQPTPGDFKKIYNFISSHYNSIISIHLSKKMSGTYQSGINASKSVKIDNIQVIDSYSASVGLGLLAIYAVDLKQSGKKYKEIVKKIQDHREKTQVFLMLKDLDYVVKGGRLPSKLKTLANFLRLRPVLGSKKGKLTARGVLYGHRNRVEKFVNFLSKKINPEKKYHIMIAHANDYENGEKLLKLLIHNHSNILKHHLLELGGALGAHAGPGGLAVGIQERK
tara:strand:+ start:1215 stop:3014 length:1800 start_codon:yes stop_codon:yes gene_type:complete